MASRTDALVADPENDRLFVLDGGRDSVVIVDGASIRVVTRIRVGRSWGAAGLAQDPSTRLLYVVGTLGIVSVIDPDRARVIREVRFGPAGSVVNVFDAAVAGGKLWLADIDVGLLVLDLETLQILVRIGGWPLGSPPVDIAADQSRPFVYVSSADRLAVIGTATMQVVRCLKIGGQLELDPERGLLYLASGKSDNGAVLRVIDARSMDQVAIVRGGLVPVDVEVDPGTGRVYVVDAGAYNVETVDADAGLVWVVDSRSNRLVRTFAVGISPTESALGSDASAMFLADPTTGALSRLATRD